MLVLFFGAPVGFVILHEFTPNAYRATKTAQLIESVSKTSFRIAAATGVVGVLVIPEAVLDAGKYILLVPGPVLICLTAWEFNALKREGPK
ncbi:MAG: hypothetical protein AAF822_17510 [Pseudomonadota bacterium]